MSDNQAAIKLLEEWMSRPERRALTRWEWRFYRGRHGCRDRYLLPSIVVAFEESCIVLREGFVTIRWWKWEVALTFDEHVYATEEIESAAEAREQ